MDGLELFSSRRFPKGGSLGSEFLVPELSGASSYKRIAGYFCASIIDVAGDELDGIIARKSSAAPEMNISNGSWRADRKFPPGSNKIVRITSGGWNGHKKKKTGSSTNLGPEHRWDVSGFTRIRYP